MGSIHLMLTETLRKLGLEKNEAEIYLTLLRYGPNRASVLARQVRLPRTTVQNILLRLEKEGAVMKRIEKNVHIFTPLSPEALPDLLNFQKTRKLQEFEEIAAELKSVTPQLLQMTQTGKTVPNVYFYRGREAVRKVLFDTLNSKTELKDFANIDAMFRYVRDINDEYVAAREKTLVTKRSLLLDTPFARQVYESGAYSPLSHKGYKWIPATLYPFSLEMNIYDGKISYITYVEDDFVGVIVENEHIYRMHDSMWNLIWNLLPARH